MTRDEFITRLRGELAQEEARRIAKYDKGAKKYGGDVNLFDRDFDKEIMDEDDDKKNYRLFRKEQSLRKERVSREA